MPVTTTCSTGRYGLPLRCRGSWLGLLIRHLDRGEGPLIFGIDETLERRRGPQISALGIYRDAVRSSRSYVVKASGLRWVSLMWLGHIPWAGRCWALPFLTVLAPSEWYYRRQGRPHQKAHGLGPPDDPATPLMAE